MEITPTESAPNATLEAIALETPHRGTDTVKKGTRWIQPIPHKIGTVPTEY